MNWQLLTDARRVFSMTWQLVTNAGNVSMPQQSNTFIVSAQQRPQLGPAGVHMPPRQPTPPPALTEDDKKFLNKPVRFALALCHQRCVLGPAHLWGRVGCREGGYRIL